jgi:hypothetical protein
MRVIENIILILSAKLMLPYKNSPGIDQYHEYTNASYFYLQSYP